VEMRFACQPGCVACCTQEGWVYLTEEDIPRLAAYLGLKQAAFEKRYVYRTRNQRRLRVPAAAHCHFLKDGGCQVHPAKPTQCRIFPFWPELLDKPKAWFKTAGYCPGIGKGRRVQIARAHAMAEEMRGGYPHMYEGK
jgi:uncharacterized protein